MFLKAMKMVLLLRLLPAVPAAQSRQPPWLYRRFASEPNILTPIIEVNVTGYTAPGHIMFAQFGAQAIQKSAIIMSEDGELLWQSTTMFDKPPSNLTPAKFQGKDVLLFWEPDDLMESDLPNNSHGQICIIDDSYQSLYNVTLSDVALSAHGQFNSLVDPHEAYMTPSGTILVLAYDTLPWDLSSVGGPREGWLRDGLVYEIDIVTNDILFSWRASDHIPISTSYAPLRAAPGPGSPGNGLNAASTWDYLHLNSATVFEDGIVISSRHAFSVTYIERRTGNVRWTLQGNGNGDFGMTASATFQWQHDVHVQRSPDGTMLVSMFNNYNNMRPPFNETTGLLLQLSNGTTDRTVTGVFQYKDPNEELSSGAGGSMQMLDNGNIFLGYGTQPVMKEYNRDGTLALSFRFGSRDSHVIPGIGSYRARKSRWRGYPETSPKVAACRYENGTMDVWMSWNGATEVYGWNVYAGNSGESHDLVAANVSRQGFETKVNVKGTTQAQVEALGGCRYPTNTRFSDTVLTKLCTGQEAGVVSGIF